jgi:hypothetical protein
MLHRLLAVRQPLQKMVTSTEWDDWRDSQNRPQDRVSAAKVEDILLR